MENIFSKKEDIYLLIWWHEWDFTWFYKTVCKLRGEQRNTLYLCNFGVRVKEQDY